MSPFASTWFALPAAFAVVHSWPPGCCVPWLSMTPPGPASLVVSSPLHLGSMKRLIERGTSLDRSDRCSRCYWNQKLFDLSPIHHPESSSNSDKDDSRIIPEGYKSLITPTHDLTPEVNRNSKNFGKFDKRYPQCLYDISSWWILGQNASLIGILTVFCLIFKSCCA